MLPDPMTAARLIAQAFTISALDRKTFAAWLRRIAEDMERKP